jgi:GNAT superfamily N-acetyltransferase
MHINILSVKDNIEEFLAFCHDMIEASYYPAYCRGAVDMLHEYHQEDNVRRDMADGRIWCAQEGRRLVGTVTICGAENELSRMFVLPEMRDRGLGRALAQKALAYARESGIKKLTAWSVPFSRSFYEKLGFTMLNADTLDFNNQRVIPVPYIEMALWPAGHPKVTVSRAEERDAVEMLVGQRIAFEEQCRIYSDWNIPPMTEQPEDVIKMMRSGGTVLKAVGAGRIIGAVRGKVEGGVCHVGRLYVLPGWQGLSVARRLIATLEEGMEDCHTFSIFTGERSEKNLALYTRHGYAPTGRRAPAMEPGSIGNYDLVWLEKPNPWPEIDQCARRLPPV